MADPREINYAGNQVIYNKEMTDQKIEEAVTAEQQRATTAEAALDTKIEAETARATEAEELLDSKIAEEVTRATNAEAELDSKIGDITTLETTAKENTVAAINELVGREDELKDRVDDILPYDEVPTEGSEKGAKSGGIFDAIRFASVKVGETMFWPVCDLEEREVHSDKPFTFTIHGVEYSVEPPDATVDMKISKDIPDGWHACDGKAELLCSEYPELAKFFGGTQNDDGSWNNDGNNVADDWIKDSDELSHSFNARIWLPYVQQKIIKVKY